MTSYHFDLICPVCNTKEETVIDKKIPPPIVYCGECLMERVSMVPMTVLKVEVVQ